MCVVKFAHLASFSLRQFSAATFSPLTHYTPSRHRTRGRLVSSSLRLQPRLTIKFHLFHQPWDSLSLPQFEASMANQTIKIDAKREFK